MAGVTQLGVAMLDLGVDLASYNAQLNKAESTTRSTVGDLEKETRRGAGGASQEWHKLAGAVGVGMGAYELVGVAVSKVKDELRLSIEAASEKAEADANLALVAGKYADETINLADALQKKLGIDDDMIKGLAAQAGAMNIQKDLLDDVALAAFEYSKVMKMDVDTALKIVVSGMHGMGRGLNRLDIDVSENASQQENLKNILAGVAGGMTIAERESGRFGGALQRINTWIDEGREKFGSAIADNEKINEAMTQLAGTIERMVESGDMEQFADDIGTIAKALADFIDWSGKAQKYMRPWEEFMQGRFIASAKDNWKLAAETFGLTAEKTKEVGDKAAEAEPEVRGFGAATEDAGEAAGQAATQYDLWGNTIEATGQMATDTAQKVGKAWDNMTDSEKRLTDWNRFWDEWQRDWDAWEKDYNERREKLRKGWTDMFSQLSESNRGWLTEVEGTYGALQMRAAELAKKIGGSLKETGTDIHHVAVNTAQIGGAMAVVADETENASRAATNLADHYKEALGFAEQISAAMSYTTQRKATMEDIQWMISVGGVDAAMNALQSMEADRKRQQQNDELLAWMKRHPGQNPYGPGGPAGTPPPGSSPSNPSYVKMIGPDGSAAATEALGVA